MVMDCFNNLPIAITIADADGKIIYMNDKSQKTFANDGGAELVGKNLFDCHNPDSNEIMRQMLTGENTNCYTIEKNGARKLIYQSTWLKSNGEIGGLAELSIVLPVDMPHKIRG